MEMLTTLIIAANLVGIPPELLSSVCFVESNHISQINAQDNGSSSYGVCQIKLNTAKLFDKSVHPSHLMVPAYNAVVAAKYLDKQLKRYGNMDKAISAYNAGKCRLNEQGLIKNRKYVTKVKSRMTFYERDKQFQELKHTIGAAGKLLRPHRQRHASKRSF